MFNCEMQKCCIKYYLDQLSECKCIEHANGMKEKKQKEEQKMVEVGSLVGGIDVNGTE
jgi:hypothetical protein